MFKCSSVVMWKKRTSSESNDQPTESCNSSTAQGRGDTKCSKVTSSSATALHDLPVKILEHILMNAIILEVKDLKLAKTSWKRRADSVISCLKTVCSKWSCLMTDIFQNEVHRILEIFAPVPIVLEMLDELQLSLHGTPVSIATTNDELYLQCSFRHDFINVYRRTNLQEMKGVIQLEFCPQAMAACTLSNCVYILRLRETSSIFRITKDDEQQSHVSPWISGMPLQNGYISISANGSLILSRTEFPEELVSIYSSEGSLQHQMRLSLGLFSVSNIIPRSSGNLVLMTFDYEFKRKLTEIDMDGNVVHQYQSSLTGYNVSSADSYHRILIVDQNSRIELLDSELNLLDITLPEQRDCLWAYPRILHYDRLRNEVLLIDYTSVFGTKCTLSIFTFTEGR